VSRFNELQRRRGCTHNPSHSRHAPWETRTTDKDCKAANETDLTSLAAAWTLGRKVGKPLRELIAVGQEQPPSLQVEVIVFGDRIDSAVRVPPRIFRKAVAVTDFVVERQQHDTNRQCPINDSTEIAESWFR
jgi:hypothetical protein